MAFFFATADDLLPVITGVEAKRVVVYTRFEHINQPIVRHYDMARQLPTLFEPQPFASANSGPKYLVTAAGAEVNLRKITRNNGTIVWSVDQLENPDSTVLQHGGLFKENILLSGEVRTCSKTTVAQRLQRAFDAAIRKHFVKIQAFWVGPAAEALLDSGCRLTAAEQCPTDFDLRR
jgi:hypothetical protein